MPHVHRFRSFVSSALLPALVAVPLVLLGAAPGHVFASPAANAAGSLGSATGGGGEADDGGDSVSGVDQAPAEDGDTPPDGEATQGETVDAVLAAEKRYSANGYDGSEAPGSVEVVDRTATSRLVLVAPHAVRHFRAGLPKAPELYTGGIAEVLGERLGASVIAVDGQVPDWGDVWAGRDDAFTRALHALPKDSVVLDLHGMKDASAAERFVLGTGRAPGPATLDLCTRLLRVDPGHVTNEGRFGATAAYTDVAHLQGLGYEAMQMEMAWGARDPKAGSLAATVDGLAGVLAGYER